MLIATLSSKVRRSIGSVSRRSRAAVRPNPVWLPRRHRLTSPRVVVVDTTFARLDMGAIMSARLASLSGQLTIERVTVPGFKDLAAASRRAINQGAAIVIACAMPGPEPIDESCASEASIGLQMVQALTGTPILEVFVHTTEALDADGTVHPGVLEDLCTHRCEAHADNAARMVLAPTGMVERAGTGRRQGTDDVGGLVQ